MKKQGSMTTPKEYNNSPEINPDPKETYEMLEKIIQNNDPKEI